MFNKTTQEVNTPLIENKMLIELPNKDGELRNTELWVIVTPSKNYYEVYLWGYEWGDEDYTENGGKIFETLKEAKEYQIKNSKKQKRTKEAKK